MWATERFGLSTVWAALFAACLLSACGGSRALPSGNAPAQFQSFRQSFSQPDRITTDTATSSVSCVGSNPNVRAANKPHGMYVWNPNHFSTFVQTSLLSVIGNDHTLCGVSFVINWRDVNPARGVYDWSYVDGSVAPPNVPSPAPDATVMPTNIAAPYATAGLRVNLLFADGPEIGAVNDVTPSYVTDPVSAGGDGVPVISCSPMPGKPGLPSQPYYPDPTFEADWATFIAAAVAHFSGESPISANIGYMRFAQGFGTEALPGHGYDGQKGSSNWSALQPACMDAWTSSSLSPPLTVATWKTHSLHVIQAISSAVEAAGSSKQMMIALNGYTGDVRQPIGSFSGYELPNAVAAAAAASGIGFGTENLGDTNPVIKACSESHSSANLYWCAPVHASFADIVPIEFQTITETTPGESKNGSLNIQTILKYAIHNKAQILELYPSEWLRANGLPPSQGASAPRPLVATNYRCAMYKAAAVLGLTAPTTPPCNGTY
jgi:hypothetical protein